MSQTGNKSDEARPETSDDLDVPALGEIIANADELEVAIENAIPDYDGYRHVYLDEPGCAVAYAALELDQIEDVEAISTLFLFSPRMRDDVSAAANRRMQEIGNDDLDPLVVTDDEKKLVADGGQSEDEEQAAAQTLIRSDVQSDERTETANEGENQPQQQNQNTMNTTESESDPEQTLQTIAAAVANDENPILTDEDKETLGIDGYDDTRPQSNRDTLDRGYTLYRPTSDVWMLVESYQTRDGLTERVTEIGKLELEPAGINIESLAESNTVEVSHAQAEIADEWWREAAEETIIDRLYADGSPAIDSSHVYVAVPQIGGKKRLRDELGYDRGSEEWSVVWDEIRTSRERVSTDHLEMDVTPDFAAEYELDPAPLLD